MKRAINLARISLLITFTLSLVMLNGCKPRLLPSTNVKATRENKQIVTFLEQYKAAFEKRSVDAIMEFIAKDFKDNMGSEDPKHYLDYLGLKERLEKTLPRVQNLRQGMFVQHIAKLEDNLYEVVFYHTEHILAEVPSGEKWLSVKDVSRMVLRRRTDKDAPYQFEIVSGV